MGDLVRLHDPAEGLSDLQAVARRADFHRHGHLLIKQSDVGDWEVWLRWSHDFEIDPSKWRHLALLPSKSLATAVGELVSAKLWGDSRLRYLGAPLRGGAA